jgi:hypothetical protein
MKGNALVDVSERYTFINVIRRGGKVIPVLDQLRTTP